MSVMCECDENVFGDDCAVCLLVSCSVLLDMAMRAYVYYHAYCINNKKSRQRYLIPPPISIYLQKEKK